ncbi:MAG: hypothetical protein ACK4Z6_06805 [Candidatus Methylomirabilales bacterium]
MESRKVSLLHWIPPLVAHLLKLPSGAEVQAGELRLRFPVPRHYFTITFTVLEALGVLEKVSRGRYRRTSHSLGWRKGALTCTVFLPVPLSL